MALRRSLLLAFALLALAGTQRGANAARDLGAVERRSADGDGFDYFMFVRVRREGEALRT